MRNRAKNRVYILSGSGGYDNVYASTALFAALSVIKDKPDTIRKIIARKGFYEKEGIIIRAAELIRPTRKRDISPEAKQAIDNKLENEASEYEGTRKVEILQGTKIYFEGLTAEQLAIELPKIKNKYPKIFEQIVRTLFNGSDNMNQDK